LVAILTFGNVGAMPTVSGLFVVAATHRDKSGKGADIPDRAPARG
jgi:hypothetical protein